MGRSFWVRRVRWVRVIVVVAVPVPEPEGAGFERAVLEGSSGSVLIVRVEHQPKQLLVISFGGNFSCARLFDLLPCFGCYVAVVVNCVASAVAAHLVFQRVADVHDGSR